MEPETVPIRIADKDYLIACQPDEREAVHASAGLLNSKIDEIRSQSKVLGSERLAILAALNIANEMLQVSAKAEGSELQQARLTALGKKIDSALKKVAS